MKFTKDIMMLKKEKNEEITHTKATNFQQLQMTILLIKSAGYH